ncbi:hypothetical protein Patl1_08293 [Pistacia atlantica]|uniref:Uncharacterized protein n=1 Tax=Pistacia atlantica TaxID=434234 RepID=A0ACC1AD90_9ROSI|nr:hypothetical protein Patl1_08293 [Pistacia atlantica]
MLKAAPRASMMAASSELLGREFCPCLGPQLNWDGLWGQLPYSCSLLSLTTLLLLWLLATVKGILSMVGETIVTWTLFDPTLGYREGGNNPCHMNSNPYMIGFGMAHIILSQIPDFDQLWWLSIVAAVMSFTYSIIGLGLGIAQVASNYSYLHLGTFKGSLTGISIGADIVKSPPSEAKTMKKVLLVSVGVTTIFYVLCGCSGCAAFGDVSPGNLLTSFSFYSPYWLPDIINAAIVIHLVDAYQVYCRPLFAFIEKQAIARFPDSYLITKEIKIPIPGFRPFSLNFFRLVWRTIFVILTTVISMLLPFFNDVVGLLGALGFWPLTVYFPVEIYIAQKKIQKWSTEWLCLQIRIFACLVITIAMAARSIAGVTLTLKSPKPFSTGY